MKRASMDRFIDTIEWIAAAFVGIVAANIFLAVLLRNLWMMLPAQMPLWTYVVACCVAAILGAITVYWLIERPLVRLFTDRERDRGNIPQATPDRAMAQ